jgi:hypothetical protein
MPMHPLWTRGDALPIIKAQRRTIVFPYLVDTFSDRFEHACEAASVNGVSPVAA